MNCLACSAMYVFRRSLPCDSSLRHRRFLLGPSILTSRASRFARVLDCRILLIAAGCCAATAAAAGTLLLVPLLLLLGSALLLLGWCCRLLLLLGLHAAGLLLLGACIRLLRQKLRQRFTTGSVAIGHAGGGDDDDRRRRCRPTTTGLQGQRPDPNQDVASVSDGDDDDATMTTAGE